MTPRFAVLPSGWAPNSGPAPLPSPIDGQPAPAGPAPSPAPAGPAPSPAPAGPAPSPAPSPSGGSAVPAPSGPSASQIRRLRHLARFKKMGKPAVKGLGRMLLGEGADMAYGWLGMGDDENMAAAMERLITDKVIGDEPYQMSEDEAADWLYRGSYGARESAASNAAEMGGTMHPYGFYTDLFVTPFIKEFGVPFTDNDGIRGITRSNEQMIRNVQMGKKGRYDLLQMKGKDGKPLYTQRDIDLQFGPLPTAETYYPLNKDTKQMNLGQKMFYGEPDTGFPMADWALPDRQGNRLDERIEKDRENRIPPAGY